MLPFIGGDRSEAIAQAWLGATLDLSHEKGRR
jgi:hypothetical protein